MSVVADPVPRGVVDSAGNFLGQPSPVGRRRLLWALPLDPGPALLRPATAVRDPGPAFLADPSPALVGKDAVWVSRMLTAVPTEDTRGMGGGGVP